MIAEREGDVVKWNYERGGIAFADVQGVIGM